MTDTMPSTNPLIMQAPLPLSSTPHAIVFVESDVEDYRSLLVGLAPGTEVHVLDAGADGLAHMAQVLAGRSGIDALHIISHGKEGAVSLGSLLLTSENMGTHAADLATIGAALEPDADILLYGCEVGAGSNGAAFVDELAKATGADVAASTNLTGATNLGGDWVLEYATGTVSSYNPFWQGATAKYAGVLDWQGVTDGTYDFSGPFTSSDTNGFVQYGDKFLITEGVMSDGAVMFYGEAGNPSGTIVIKAEGGEVAKTFTFRDLSFSLFDWDGSGETPFTLNSLTIVTRKANGDTIDTHTRSTLYAPGTATEFKASDIMDDAGPIFDEDVASITISWTLGGDGRVSEADVSAANLNFHSITIADVTAEAPGDTTAPVVESITRATTGSGVTNLPTLQYTVTFSESVTGVDGNDFTLITTSGNAAGTIGTVTPNADGSTYTVTINDITGTGILRLDLKNSGTGIQDEAGNPAATGFTNGQLYSVDRTAPSVTSIAPANPGSGATNATSVTYTVTFSEAVTGVTADDFVLFPTGTATGTVSNVSGSGTTWTVTANGISGDGTLRLDLKNNGTGIVDLAGNLVSGGFSSGAAYTFDHTAPRVDSITLATPVSGPTSLDTLTYTVTFSERVTGVNADGFQLNSDGFATGSVGTVVGSADGRTYTVTVNGVTGDGMLRLDLKSSGTGIVDTAGNAAPGYTAGEAYDVDRVPPTIDSVGVPASRTYHAGENLDFTVNYSEAVTVDATNGTPFFNLVLDTGGTVKAEYVSGSGTSALTFRYVVVPGNADANGIVVDSATGIDPATGTIRDLAGNGASTAFSGVVAPTSGVLVNALAPTVTSIVRAGDELTNATSVTYTVTFSESVTGVDASDFTLVSSDGVTGNIAPVSGSGATWTVTVNDIAGDGALRLDLNASGTGIQGGSGQAIAGGYTAGQHYTFDRTAPVLSSAIEISDTALKTDETATVTFRFSEAVKDFTTAHVTVPNGELSGLSSADGGRTWTATLAPDAGVAAASNVLTLHYAGITDLAGNASTGTATSINYAIDTERPHLVSTIAISDTTLTSGDTATVTFTFNEAVTGFTIENVDVPNGTLSTLDSSDGGKTWTATLTPKSGASDTSNVLTLHYAGITDLAGNAAIGEIASGNYAVDTTAPALAEPIDIDDTALRIGETATVTFVFAQAVTGFTSANVSVPNGALSEPTSEDGITWTATLTPNPGATAHANVLTLNYAGILNGAGNANSGIVTSGNYAVDTRAPTATVTLSDLDLRAGETAQLTVSFDEIVSGFDKSAVTAPNGALGDFTTLDDGKTWSATFTPTANTNVASNVISVSLAGVSDLAGNPGAGSASSPTYAVQTTPPVTPPTNPPTNPPATGTVDGVTVERETLPVDPVTGLAGTALIVPVITSSRPDDPNTPNGDLADIPLGLGSGTGPRTELMVSLPVGTGMRAEGPSSLLTNAQALLDLIRRIENQTEAGSSAQLGMTGNGAGFLGSLAPDTLLQSQTLVLSAAPGLVAPQTILVNGSSTTPVGGGQNATAIGLVIDTTGLPAGSTLQLNNVDFAAIVGAATVRGGDGRNFVTGDDASQNIFLGADDDVLMGGGGNDIIGSAGGNDLLDGGSGDDILVGGIGNDRLVGGAGNNVLQGGRSTQGGWEFYLAANGTLMARHETALFAPGQEERLALAELNESATELAFLDADKAMLSSLSLLYHAAFGRAPDLGGLAYWALGGASIEAVADYILRSPEWQSAGGTAMSDTAFVEAVYGNAFGRAPDAGGLAYWTGMLAGAGGAPALGRAEALVAIAHSAEHHSAWNTADGYLIGEADLDLEADWIVDDGIDTAVYGGKSADYKFIVDGDGRLKVEHKTSGALDQLVGIDLGEFSDGTLDLGFLQGNQATVKQLGLLYQTVLDRAGDLGGFQWWLGRDIDGARLVQDFIATDEFRARYDGISDAAFVQALYDNSGLDATAVGGMASWENYLANHTRAELIATWLTQDGVVDAQFTGPGLWVV